MQAIIFAAGKSTRTYPLTLTKPKPLLKAGNKTLIEHNLEQLEGIADEAIIVIGYKGEMIKEKIKDRHGSISVKYVVQEKMEGTGQALLLCKDMLKDRFIAMNGDDIYYSEDIKNIAASKYCVLAAEVHDISRFGEINTEGKRATGITEKPKRNEPGLAYTGLMAADVKIFEAKIRKSQRGEYEVTDYLREIMKKEEVFVVTAANWYAISYPWNLLDANESLLSRIELHNEGIVEPGATLKGKISIGADTLIRSGSYIEGPVVIGDNCVIGPNCYIRPKTSIGDNSKIGNAVEIKNSIIGDNSHVGHLSYVGDSILGDNVNLGAGTITANLRHDGKSVKSKVKSEIVDTDRRKLGAIIGDDVHTGIHTSIYPGRKLWPGMTTLPGEVVKEDKESDE